MEEWIFELFGMYFIGFFFEDMDLSEEDMFLFYIYIEIGEMVEFEQGNLDWVFGGGGLVFIGIDYICFVMMLVNGGVLGDVCLVQLEILLQMGSFQVMIEQLGGGWGVVFYGFGFVVVLFLFEGQELQGVFGDIFWGGMFDIDFFVSLVIGVFVVLMIQIQLGLYCLELCFLDVFWLMVYGLMVFEDQQVFNVEYKKGLLIGGFFFFVWFVGLVEQGLGY